jgi:outer membrane protein OmpA-like peptidoglycan-associated protein
VVYEEALVKEKNTDEYLKELVINFDFDSTQVNQQSFEVLREAKSQGLFENKKLYVAGYTDTRGSVEYNMKLALKRAMAIKNKLISMGYKGEIEILSHGKSKPLFDSAKNERQHSKNRRVEVYTTNLSP